MKRSFAGIGNFWGKPPQSGGLTDEISVFRWTVLTPSDEGEWKKVITEKFKQR
jgi:hypothetical protein